MFNLFKKNSKPEGQTITLRISGMHCSSCALNIDSTLEETPGILRSDTNYAKSATHITYDPQKIQPIKFQAIIKSLGYTPTSIP